MRIFAAFFLICLPGFGVTVTSQEQFKRVRGDDLPENVSYNFERAYLEVQANENCPSRSRGFFSLHISKDGDVSSVRGHLVALSADLRSLGLEWANALLKQIHFRPLMYGVKPSSVDTALTLVCVD
jgi:hypothetical protein